MEIVADDGPGPSNLAAAGERVAALRSAIPRLTPKQRAAVNLRKLLAAEAAGHRET